MNCLHCGFAQRVEGKYCNNCGAQLPEQTQTEIKTSRLKVVAILLGSLIFFCGFGGLLWKLAERSAPAPMLTSPALPSPTPTVPPLSPEEIRELLRADYELTMRSAHRHLNIIKAKITKTIGTRKGQNSSGRRRIRRELRRFVLV